MVDALKNKANNLFMSVATPFMGVLTESVFKEKGLLTPEEFVQAGDQLTSKCPTWEWSAGDDSVKSKHLPPNKQFLITKGVPCEKRIAELKQYMDVAEREAEDGWVETQNPNAPAGGKKEAGVDIDDIDAMDAQVIDGGEEESKEAVDIDADDAENIFETAQERKFDTDAVKQIRRYDLSISYDFFYQTPRLWLFGYAEDNQVLSKEAILDDVMADYANKTVTFEVHPHKPKEKWASIHPCNHGKVMKKMIDTVAGNGGEIKPHQSLFTFLKFISSVVPTIEYDFTVDLELE